MSVSSTTEPALDAWRHLQREHNATAPPERFTEPAARTRAPEPAAAAAVPGEVASLLPLQLGERMAGVSAAPPARENKTAAQRRWRKAAITAMLAAKEPVTPAPLLLQMNKLRSAEAERRGIDASTMYPLQTSGALGNRLSKNNRTWQAFEGSH